MHNTHLVEGMMKEKQREMLRQAREWRLAKEASAGKTRSMPVKITSRINVQLVYLFISNLSILLIGWGLFPLLPVYASHYGATSAAIGVYLAITYISITLGTLVTSWLPPSFALRKVFVAAGIAGVLALALLGQVSALWQVVLLTGIVWFTGGVGLSLLKVFASQQTAEGKRGKSFSFLSLTTPLGAITGGLLVGRLVEAHGYTTMFALLSGVYAIWPALGMFKLEIVTAPPAAKNHKPVLKTNTSEFSFRLLMLVALLTAMTISVNRMGLSMLMKASSFSPAAITSTSVIGGLVTIPVVLWFGVLSDRLGRKVFLASGYLMAAGGGLSLMLGQELWHFWAVGASVLLGRAINDSLATAIAADLLAPASLGRKMPQLNSMSWAAGVIGFIASGFVMEVLGANTLFLVSVSLAVGAAALVGLLPENCKAPAQPHFSLRFNRTVRTAEVEC